MNSIGPNLVRLAGRNGHTRVVVTGMGTVNPLGKDLEEYWDGLIEGRSTARNVESFPTQRLATKFACEIHNFDPQNYMDRKAAQRMARFSQIAVAASGEIEPSEGHMPRGFWPKARSCEAMASSIWKAASSG